MNILNDVLNNKQNDKFFCDLVIVHRSEDMMKLSNNIRAQGLFKNVFDITFIDKKSNLFKVLIVLFPKFFLRFISLNNTNNLQKKNRYDILISQNIFYLSIFSRLNLKSKQCLIDEGISSYTNRTSNPHTRSNYFYYANKYIFGGDLLTNIDYYYLNRAEMFAGDSKKVKQLPRNTEELRIIYNNVFFYKKNNTYVDNLYIYLGVPLFGLKDLIVNKSIISKNFEKKCEYILHELFNTLNNTKFVYRKHPLENSKGFIDIDNCLYDNGVNMWEVETQNNITNNHVLISFFSTATLTPKILYDKEPYVLFLFEILGFEFFSAYDIIRSLKDIYNDPSKVIIVKDVTHLNIILNRIHNNQKLHNTEN